MDFTILVVDDEVVQAESLAGFFEKQGYKVLRATAPAAALQFVGQQPVDLVLTDFKMPDMNGVELMNSMKAADPGIDVIVMTAYGSVESATAAMKAGASDYISKPLDLYRLKVIVGNILDRRMLVSENLLLRKQLTGQFRFDRIVSSSRAMDRVLNMAGRVGPSRAAVLISGETGTGKELIARAVHYAGADAEKPFVAVNCAALSETLLESELFGHEKGSFTGADRQRQGRFEAAEGGTLFLDEVGEMPLSLQVKLLRVLQEKSIERVGSNTPIPINVRIVAATNRDIETMVKDGCFRSDLYYRLNVVSIRVPPLRERRDDILPIADFFLKRFAAENARPLGGFSREAVDILVKYDYPGNVRELENIVHQAVVLSRGTIVGSDDLPQHLSDTRGRIDGNTGSGTFPARVEAFERALIRQALSDANGVQTHAAHLLGLSERHLRYKLKKYGMK